ncbi:hypothetical protein EV122DRAFT_285340 [Schizophyllum commune]
MPSSTLTWLAATNANAFLVIGITRSASKLIANLISIRRPPQLRRVDLATYALQRLHPPIPSFIHSMFLGHIGPTEMLLEIGMNSISVLACTEQDNLLEVSDGYKVRAKLVPEPVPGSTTLSKIDRH